MLFANDRGGGGIPNITLRYDLHRNGSQTFTNYLDMPRAHNGMCIHVF